MTGRRTTRRWLRHVAVAILIGTGLAVSGSVIASAQNAHQTGLSWTGTSWASSLSGELFDSSRRWVPGDSATKSFHVRNQSNDRATLTVTARSTGDTRWVRTGDLAVEARIGSGGWVGLDRLADGYQSTSALDAGADLGVAVRAVFDRASTNPTQGRELNLDFTATLTDASTSSGNPETGNPGNGNPENPEAGGELPNTGASDNRLSLILASLMIGVGLALIIGRRRSEDNESDDFWAQYARSIDRGEGHA